jgi:curved DNA-binding protein
MKKAKDASNPNEQQKPENPLVSNLKGMFSKSQSDEKSSLAMDFAISIPPAEALNGTRKKVSYRANGITEQLMVRIPPNFPSGGKLRIRNKGHIQNEKRGDLILSINIDLKTSTSN